MQVKLSSSNYKVLISNWHGKDSCVKAIEETAKEYSIVPNPALLSDRVFLEKAEIEFGIVSAYRLGDYTERDADLGDWTVGWLCFEIVLATYDQALMALTILYEMYKQDVQPWNLIGVEYNAYFGLPLKESSCK